MWPRWNQCERAAKVGDFCKQHSPDVVAERRKKADEKYEASTLKWRTEVNGAKFLAVLRQIAEGHNDARGLATETVRKFDEGS